MRQRLNRFVTASMLLGLLAAPQLTASGFPGRAARRAARTAPLAPLLAAVQPERSNEHVARLPSAPSQALPPSATPDEHALAEIARIRDAHGSVLKGSFLEAPLVPEPQSPRTQNTQPHEPSVAKQLDPFRTALRQIAVTKSPTPTASAATADQAYAADNYRAESTSPDLTLIHSLRAASRTLDTKASDFEDARRFPDAERLRALAQQLRQEARSLERAHEQSSSP